MLDSKGWNVTPGEDVQRVPLELSGSQRALQNALARRSAVLETMYIGGLTVLRDEANPDRFALCAHSLRELIEKLPEHFSVPQEMSDKWVRWAR